MLEHDIEFHFVQRAVTKAWMAGGLAADKDTKTSVVTGDKLSDLTGDALRAKIVEEYGEGAVLEVEKAYPGETGNWEYDDWRYHMYLYAASDPTEGASEGTETESPAVIVVNPYDLTGGELRKYVSDEYGEAAVLEVEKAYPGETGNWGYDDWRYYMYLYAASEPMGVVDGSKVDTKPYTNSRPSFRNGVVEEVWENAKDSDGLVRDPNTGEVINWTPGESRKGIWDMGHIPEAKYSEMHEAYMKGELTVKEFVDWYNDPANYRPELPSNNRSHKYE